MKVTIRRTLVSGFGSPETLGARGKRFRNEPNFLLVNFHDYATGTVPNKGDGMLCCSARS